ncbi:MAG TPA: PqqD family peptide modification chaperone [Thermoanaerobaculaceae bacterium]|nr:PqqD family peptide modification chaperone [Thermoanaerobaculaceae bacterium]HRS16926.1 PqqD family peptide modification chaperone [Thermoanaerobaculaceae bacterium]
MSDEPSRARRTFRVRDDVAVEGFDDGGLVLRLSDRQFVELDPVALFIVEQTDGTRSVGAIAGLVRSHFEGADGDVESDVIELYESLLASRVVDEVVPDGE